MKKLIIRILALCLVFSLLPIYPVYAEETTEPQAIQQETVSQDASNNTSESSNTETAATVAADNIPEQKENVPAESTKGDSEVTTENDILNPSEKITEGQKEEEIEKSPENAPEDSLKDTPKEEEPEESPEEEEKKGMEELPVEVIEEGEEDEEVSEEIIEEVENLDKVIEEEEIEKSSKNAPEDSLKDTPKEEEPEESPEEEEKKGIEELPVEVIEEGEEAEEVSEEIIEEEVENLDKVIEKEEVEETEEPSHYDASVSAFQQIEQSRFGSMDEVALATLTDEDKEELTSLLKTALLEYNSLNDDEQMQFDAEYAELLLIAMNLTAVLDDGASVPNETATIGGGTGFIWTFDDTDTLTVSGDSTNQTPGFNDLVTSLNSVSVPLSTIKKVVVQGDLESFQFNLSALTNLEELIFEEGIKIVYTSNQVEFRSYKNLKRITFPESTTSVDYGAFSDFGGTVSYPCVNKYKYRYIGIDEPRTTWVPIHQSSNIGHVDATCTTEGVVGGNYCPVCNDGKYDAEEIISAKGHSNTPIPAVAATCTATGLTEGQRCSVCNVTTVAQTTVDALGHKEVGDNNAVAATCTASGLTESKHCSVCNQTTVAQTTVSATGHKEVVDATKNPTCTDTGLTEGKHCSVCGDIIVAQATVNALGHSMGSWTVTTAADVGVDGKEERKCADCPYTESKTIPALPLPATAAGAGAAAAANADTSTDLTRADVIYWLWMHEGCPQAKGVTIQDCVNHKFSAALAWAEEIGLIEADENGNYKPNEIIPVGDVQAILALYAKIMGVDYSVVFGVNDSETVKVDEAYEALEKGFGK